MDEKAKQSQVKRLKGHSTVISLGLSDEAPRMIPSDS